MNLRRAQRQADKAAEREARKARKASPEWQEFKEKRRQYRTEIALRWIGNALRFIPRLLGIPVPFIEGSIKNENNLYLNENATNMQAKNILKSKTFWFNIGTGLFALVQKELLGAQVLDNETITLIVGIGNIVLRKLTKSPVNVLPEVK